jgi:hypothetical protein
MIDENFTAMFYDYFSIDVALVSYKNQTLLL